VAADDHPRGPRRTPSRRFSGLLRLFDDLRRARGESCSTAPPDAEDETGDEPQPAAPIIEGFEIGGLIGQGGMGQVWKATDTALDAQVAIKVLHAADLHPQAAQRFLREAKSMASVRHPNIVHIYAFGQSAGGPYFVMEFVAGQSLAQRIDSGPMDVEEALAILDQVVVALDAAWQKNIVHRDVKPANILIDDSGWVRVCDFGLAKPIRVGASSITTQSGMVVGTPHYMSPEQATGRALDFRSDVYSLGVVLYEMLTGETPFRGDSPIEVVAQHLHEPLPTPPRELPAGVAELLEWMTEKDPRDRPSSYAELAAEIRALKDDAGRRSGLRRNARVAAAAILVVGAAAVLWTVLAPTPSGPTTTLVLNERFVTGPWSKSDPRISPDGNWISFISDRNGPADLWAQSLTGDRAQLLVEADGIVVSHAWSQDGTQIACLVRVEDGLFLQIAQPWSSARESVRVESPFDEARLLRWADGYIYIFFPREYVLRRVRLPGLQFEDVIGPGFEPRLLDVDMLAGERQLVFVGEADGREDLWVVNVDGSGLLRLTDDDSRQYSPRWFGDAGNSILYLSDQSGQIDIWEIDARGRWRREITNSADIEGRIDVSTDGLLAVYESSSEESDIWAIDARGEPRHQETSESLLDLWPSLGGTKLAFQRSRPSVAGFLLFDGDIRAKTWGAGEDGAERVLAASGFGPRISPDGRWVAFFRLAESGGESQLWVVNAETQEPHLLSSSVRIPGFTGFPTEWNNRTIAWSPDAESLFFVEVDANRRQLLRRTTLSGDEPVTNTVVDGPRLPLELIDPHVSPDGTRVDYLLIDEARNRREVVDLSLETSESQPVYVESSGSHVYIRGWYGDAPLIARGVHDVDGTETVEVLVHRSGEWRPVGDPIPHAAGRSAVFEPGYGALVIGAYEQGVYNLVELDLSSGQISRLTNNTVANVAQSSVAIGPAGRLVYARQQQDRDLWKTSFARR